MNNARKSALVLIASAVVLTIALRDIERQSPSHPRQAVLKTRQFGDVIVASPGSASQGLTLLFADWQRFPPAELARQIASSGSAAAAIDNAQAFHALTSSENHCVQTQALEELIQTLSNWAEADDDAKRIIAGIGDGAILPYLAAQNSLPSNTEFLSIDFSIKLPAGIQLCSPLTEPSGPSQAALPKTPHRGHWRAVWTDQPPNETAIFVRADPNAEMVIAPYDTPLDQVALNEIASVLGTINAAAPPMPVVEIPAERANPTLTLFYSGDGGWRDLDRAVAQEMAQAGFPVAGIDVLRYFWERKTPEQAARDLSATMAYYRKTQGARSFVLAGYSFGADILPPVFNRLPPADQDAVKLLVLLAVADQADFEIHVSGWLGQQNGDMPLAPELAKIPSSKLLCVYGSEEKDHRGCKGLENSAAELLELPGGHHFDQDYPKLARRIIDAYHRHALQSAGG